MFYLSFAGVLLTEISILCRQSVAQKVPLNYILLLIFTLCESYLMIYIVIYYEPLSVLICARLTLALVIGLKLYAIFTGNNITMCRGTLASLSLIKLVLDIIGAFYTSVFYQALDNSCGLFFFSLYLIYDTQLVIGKNKKFISTDNYIVGALMIYIDIVSLFINILMLFGKEKTINIQYFGIIIIFFFFRFFNIFHNFNILKMKFIMEILFLNFIIINFIKAIIVIPLQKRNQLGNLTNIYDFINYFQPNNLYTSLKIDEPQQDLEVIIKDGEMTFSINPMYFNSKTFCNKNILKTFKNITKSDENNYNFYGKTIASEVFYIYNNFDLIILEKIDPIYI